MTSMFLAMTLTGLTLQIYRLPKETLHNRRPFIARVPHNPPPVPLLSPFVPQSPSPYPPHSIPFPPIPPISPPGASHGIPGRELGPWPGCWGSWPRGPDFRGSGPWAPGISWHLQARGAGPGPPGLGLPLFLDTLQLLASLFLGKL